MQFGCPVAGDVGLDYLFLAEISAFAKGIVESIRQSLARVCASQEAVKEKGEVLGAEVDEGDADDGALGGAGVCVAELDALQAIGNRRLFYRVARALGLFAPLSLGRRREDGGHGGDETGR